jgi:hypothetical protein
MPFTQVFDQISPLELAVGLEVFGLVLAALATMSRCRRRRGRPAAHREHWNALAAFGVVLTGVAAFLVVESFSASTADFLSAETVPAVQPATAPGSCQDGQCPMLVLPAGRTVQISSFTVTPRPRRGGREAG